ncbi:lachrymatory-factor synthase-like, partial [Hevea brasiliensis]|uniref:lachrymatory-factor synthase-like n=1 Tax=Hevea brasiliensis TaxID=3981 RepID=UPI0025E683DF
IPIPCSTAFYIISSLASTHLLLTLPLPLPLSLSHTHTAEETGPKWEGKTSLELKGATADQALPFFEDFCNIHKWFPNLETGYQVEGELGKPGLIRYCAFKPQASSDSTGGNIINWAKEKLIMINTVERFLSYGIIENNMGYNSYTATFEVLPISGDGAGDQKRCKIEWSFVCDPIEGWKLQDANSFRNSTLQLTANKIEQALCVST